MHRDAGEAKGEGRNVARTKRIKSGLSDCEESMRCKILWGNGQKLHKVEDPSTADEAKREAADGA